MSGRGVHMGLLLPDGATGSAIVHPAECIFGEPAGLRSIQVSAGVISIGYFKPRCLRFSIS